MLVCAFINFVNRESLEDIKMGSVSVAPGDTIYDVSKKMQKSLIASGSDWKICVDGEILGHFQKLKKPIFINAFSVTSARI